MSGHNRFSDEFKRDAVSLVVDRGYPVAEVAERLGFDLSPKFPPPRGESLGFVL